MPKRDTPASILTEQERDLLLTGFRFPKKTLADPAAELAAWRAHRAEIMDLCREELGPFRRPYAWWEYDAPGPRLELAAGRIKAHPEHGLYFGMPRMFDRQPMPPDGPRYESTRAYLVRLNLPLTPEERALLRRTEDPDPAGVYVGQETQTIAEWKKWLDWCLAQNKGE